MVEAEGCMVEHHMVLGEQLLCYHRASESIMGVELYDAAVERCHLASASALLVSTPRRQYLLALRNDDIAVQWAAEMQALTSCVRSVPRHVFFGKHATRWDEKRMVLNNTCLCLEPRNDALALSAELLRLALSAQDADESDELLRLNRASCDLKCADLSRLSVQDIWGFWVNVFHTLLLHARIICGLPQKLSLITALANRMCYVVAGHVFSLTEIEHCVLRCGMSRPHLAWQRTSMSLKVWKRSDEYLEERPILAAPACEAAAFRCRPDWRLNLVLSVGNFSCGDTLPVFESCGAAEFNALVCNIMECTLFCAGSLGESAAELPPTLKRYRDDAPRTGNTSERSLSSWTHALFPGQSLRVAYPRRYDWRLRPHLFEYTESRSQSILSFLSETPSFATRKSSV